MIVLDTDTCVDLLRGNTKVIENRRRHREETAVSFMTAAELYYGVEKSSAPAKNRLSVDQFLLSVQVLHSDLGILRRFGELKARLEGEGRPIADADLLIAATTLEKASQLVTANKRHFNRIPGLAIENWR